MKGRARGYRVFRWAILITLAAALWYLTQRFTFPAVRDEDDSMLPTLSAGKRYVCEQLSWSGQPPIEGDVVAFLARLSDEERPEVELHFARVAGVPGDLLEEGDGVIVVNGKAWKHHRWSETLGAGPIPQGRFLLLNDNEMSSVSDSRRFGLVDRRAIIARVFPHAELF